MIISLFSSAKDNSVQRLSTNWEGFCKDVIGQKHKAFSGEKTSCPAFSPAEYDKGAKRSKANVKAVHLAVFDYDGIGFERLGQIIEDLDGNRFLIYTSYSHETDKSTWRIRLVLDLDRPVSPEDWPRFWAVLANKLSAVDARGNSVLDLTCKDASRIYFLPYTPDPDSGYIETFEGQPINVDEVMAEANNDVVLIIAKNVIADAAEARTQTLTKEELREYGKRLTRSATVQQSTMGRWITQVADGQPYAYPGSRHSTSLAITAEVEKAFPLVPVEGLAELFMGSLFAMQADNFEPMSEKAQIEKDLLGARKHRLSEQAKRKAVVDAANAADISAALGGERQTPYTSEELTLFATNLGVNQTELKKRWLIQNGTCYYVYVGGKYLAPITDKSLLGSVRRDLAPAVTAGVNVRRMEQSGTRGTGQWVRKGKEDLMEDYGTVARNAVASYLVPNSNYDVTTQTFYEAAAPVRNITPSFSHEVDAWLQLLGGDESYADLCRWLSFMWDLSQPLVALYIEGPPGAGKSLLAEGVARAWGTEGATKADAAVAHFNAALLGNPLVLADDHIPKVWTKDSGKLREFISERHRELERKFMPRMSLEGCIRLVITANNQDLIRSSEVLTENDRAGILARLYHVKATKAATEYLEKLGTARVRAFVDQDELAKHAAWLRDNMEDARTGRFGIVSDRRDLHNTMKHSQHINAALGQWLVAYLLRPEVYGNQHKGAGPKARWLRVHEGTLYVNINAFCGQADWQLYVSNPPIVPSLYHLGRSLAEYAPNRFKLYGIQYRAVDTEGLRAFVRDTPLASEQEIVEALAKLSADAERAAKQEVN